MKNRHVVFLVSACLTGCAAQKPNSPAILDPATQAQAPRDNYVAGVQNFGFVSKDVWRGEKPSAIGYQSLAAMGVGTIIDLQESDESSLIPQRTPAIQYVRIPTSPWHSEQVDVHKVLETIRTSPKPVFIHCELGRDRTGMAVAAYRLSTGFTASEAIRELDNFHVDFLCRAPIVARIQKLEPELHQ